MSLNANFESIGNSFVQEFYAVFDDPEKRTNIVNFYNPNGALMTFEGQQIEGADKILEKFKSLCFQKITRLINAVDSQPTFDGGVLITVIGRLKCDEEMPRSYSQVFYLQPNAGTFYLAHDIFRLNTLELA
ncbi:hypothetical protein KR018_002024 [Drosophila ironensis]|nr:hypothetical protein KR018_002024 [Drosophila ironensis]